MRRRALFFDLKNSTTFRTDYQYGMEGVTR